MVKAIITALVAIFSALAMALARASGKASRAEEEAQIERQKAELLKRQMETVNEVRKELKLTEAEEPPKVEEAPPRGDSDSRLDRLNRLHDH